MANDRMFGGLTSTYQMPGTCNWNVWKVAVTLSRLSKGKAFLTSSQENLLNRSNTPLLSIELVLRTPGLDCSWLFRLNPNRLNNFETILIGFMI